jgi:ABC-type Mn2+/Zn2+ transport system ATPase subunit
MSESLVIQVEESIHLPNAKCRFDLKLEKGKVHWLVGENGIGKSSLFNYLKMRFNSKAQTKIAFLDQFPLTPLVDYTLSTLIEILKKENVLCEKLSLQYDLLNLLGINDFLNLKISQLSGGQNQLLKIYLCFSQPKEFYFLDEPFVNLDLNKSNIVKNLIDQYAQDSKAMLIIEHRKEVMQGFKEIVVYEMRYQTADEVVVIPC